MFRQWLSVKRLRVGGNSESRLDRSDYEASVRLSASQFLLAIFFVLAGVLHFVVPRVYLTIMPPYLPWPAQLVAVSGVAEILGGIGVLNARTRRPAGWGLIVLLVAVFPANVHAIAAGLQIGDHAVPVALLWARLPLQLLLIAWIYRACLRLHKE